MTRWDARFLLGLSLLSGAAWAQNKADINTITRVEIRGATVEIVGTKQPSFTSFTMTDPARLVIDMSEAVFSGVPEQIPGAGVVSSIKTASYGSDASSIARVLIGFSKDVETDLASAGSKLVIKILDGSPPALARAEKPAPTPKAEPARQETKQVEAPRAEPKQVEAPPQLQLATPAPSGDIALDEEAARRKYQAKPKESGRAEPDRLAQEKAEKESTKQAEQKRFEEARQAEADAKRRAAEERSRQAEQDRLAEQQRRAEAEEAKRDAAAAAKRQAEEARLAREKAAAEAEDAKRQAAAERKRLADEERLARENEKAQAAEVKRQATAERKSKAEEDRLAQQKAREEAAEAKQQAAAERKGKLEEERLAKESARQEALAAKREAKLAVRGGPNESPGGSRRRATMTFVGFQRAAEGSRVYVRTTGPVNYSVQQEGDKKVVLELENTRIALRNNRRALDTSFFDAAVAMVSPNPASNRTVRIEIKLKEAVPFQARQDGNEVSVEFSRPSHP